MKNPIRHLLLAATLGVSAPAIAEQHTETKVANTQTTLNAAPDTKTQLAPSVKAEPAALDA